ncbi:MAG: hypothetical protein AB7E76_04895 [Deferribacterales bacterium]
MYTAWDSALWTGANTNLGLPLLQWQDITDVALTVDGTYTYGTGLLVSDFLANADGYDTVEYKITDAEGNDVTSQAEAGTLTAGTYTVSVLIDGEYTVTNTGAQITLGKKELGIALGEDTVTYGDSYSVDVSFTGVVDGGADVTGSTAYTVLDADGNDVTAQADAGTLGAGTYTVHVSLTDSNYTAGTATTTFTVEQKSLGYTLTPSTIEYGSDLSSISISYTDDPGNVTGTVAYTVYDADGNDVTSQAEAGTLPAGEYTITAELTDDNYTLGTDEYTMTVLADDSQQSQMLLASITPAIMSNLASQPVIQIPEYTPASAPEYTQQSGSGESGNAGAGEAGNGGEQIGDSGDGAQIGYIGAGRGFSGQYTGLVEIINGGIRMPE